MFWEGWEKYRSFNDKCNHDLHKGPHYAVLDASPLDPLL